MADPKNYTVGWICAIKTEFVAAQVLLDEKHDPPEYIAERDNNSYALGRIHKHNVAIAVLPDGEYGLSQATAVARDMLHTFPNIRIGLMVGIGGGAPTSKNDIRLGDVVVSAPRNGYSGVFEYDFGKTIQERNFQYTKHLDQPPVAIRAAVASLQADYECNGHNIRETINKIIEKNKRLRKYARPDISTDLLYRSEVIHPADSGACMEACGVDPRKIIPRKQRDEDEGDDDPTIHYGLIASANQLMKDATVRDHLATERGVLCFEMEAAGLMNHFPCLVIRGICDYSDTHKNDNWHGYASMTAAVYAADILRRIHPSRVEAEKKIAEVIESVQDVVLQIRDVITSDRQDEEITAWLGASNPSNKHNAVRQSRHEGTGAWFLNDQRYKNWKNTVGSFLWLSGIAGCGKTVLSSTVIDDLRSCHSSADLVYFYFQFDDETKPTLDSLLRSLISQCYWKSEEAKICVRALWKELTTDIKGQQPTQTQLYDCLVRILTQSSRFWVVIDALDESTTMEGSFTQGILAFIEALRKVTLKHTHILVTSRVEQVIDSAFSRWVQIGETIPLQQCLIHQDIESYIEYQLKRSGGFNRWRDRIDILDKIKSTLMSQVDGMFRWAACQLDSLVDCLDPQSLKETLSSLPRGLDATYQRMIQGIPESKKSNAVTILRFLAFSDRPLTLDELVDALAVNTATVPPTFDPANRMPWPYEIFQYCPSLVILQRVHKERKYKEKNTRSKELIEVRLAHFSVKEFPTSDRLQMKLRQKMEVSSSRAFLAKICVAYLSQINEEMTKTDIEEAFSFAKYSAQSWIGHAAARPPVKNAEIDTLILNLFLFNKVAYENWYRVLSPDVFCAEPLDSGVIYVASCRYYACFYGMTVDVEALLSYSVDVNEWGGQYHYALLAAAVRGHERIVSLLLANGANVHSKGPRQWTALRFASEAGHEMVYRLLLGAGAEVNALDIWYRTILEELVAVVTSMLSKH